MVAERRRPVKTYVLIQTQRDGDRLAERLRSIPEILSAWEVEARCTRIPTSKRAGVEGPRIEVGPRTVGLWVAAGADQGEVPFDREQAVPPVTAT